MTQNAEAGWQVFQIEELLKKVEGNDPRFFEFLRVPSMSMAIYRLPVGASDMQSPHPEDEIYVVIEGRARLIINDEEQEAVKGSILFVARDTPHTFFDIEESLTVLAFFGPHLPPIASYGPDQGS
jgi:mannose-6-phosphate isomerase-like protein (cupin superfamily)